MKKQDRTMAALGVLFVAIVFVVGGCGTSQNPIGPEVSADDEVSLRALVEDNLELFTYDIDDGSGAGAELNYDPETAKVIEPVAFWREITSREKDIDIHIAHPGGDSLPYAEVTVTTHFVGLFHSVTMDSEYTKEIDDTAIRYAYLEKRNSERLNTQGRHYGGWKLIKISGWEVTSSPCTKEIHSVQISSSSGLVDTTITEISSLWDVSDLFVFDPGDSVTLTVDTGDPDDLVFLHAPLCLRRPFRHIGGGVFTGTWVIAEDPHVLSRPRHAAIDVIDHGTVFDDAMPYDSKAWGLVYYVGEGSEEQ